MKRFLDIPFHIVLAIIFAYFGVRGFIGSQEFYDIVSVLGLSSAATHALVFLIGPLDCSVALILFSKQNKWVFLWAGIWPWIPRALEFFGGLEVEFGESPFVSILAILAYRSLLTKEAVSHKEAM